MSTIGILGAGQIGQAFARALARNDIPATIANSRGPDTLTDVVGDIGPTLMVRQNLKRYAASPALTEFQSFPGRSHFLIASPGWEEIADHALQWASRVRGR